MRNPRLAGRYAKSLLTLSIDQNSLENVYQDIMFIRNILKANKDFLAILKSPVITSDKKQKIINAVIQNNVNPLTQAFINLLINKTRESNLEEIASAFISQYNELKNIHIVKITTATPLTKEMESLILNKIRQNPSMQNLELHTEVKDELIGGFKLEVGDVLIDATILRDLNDVKKQFKTNEYIHNIR